MRVKRKKDGTYSLSKVSQEEMESLASALISEQMYLRRLMPLNKWIKKKHDRARDLYWKIVQR